MELHKVTVGSTELGQLPFYSILFVFIYLKILKRTHKTHFERPEGICFFSPSRSRISIPAWVMFGYDSDGWLDINLFSKQSNCRSKLKMGIKYATVLRNRWNSPFPERRPIFLCEAFQRISKEWQIPVSRFFFNFVSFSCKTGYETTMV